MISRDDSVSRPVFRIADHVRMDISDRPLWTMLLSGPNLFQNAMFESRRFVSHVAKETFPNLVSRLVQTASNPKTVRPNQWLECHVRVQTDQKVVRTSNLEHWSRRSKHWYDSDQVTKICHRLQRADPVAHRRFLVEYCDNGKNYALSICICCIQQKEQ